MDVVIVGGGPVGLVAAIHAAQSGLSVTVVEARVEPIDKACGEGLMPSGLLELQLVGVDPPGHPMQGIRYLDARSGDAATATFQQGPGRGIRRTVLHEHLARRAKQVGAEIVQCRSESLENRARQVEVRTSIGTVLTAEFAIAADGLHSPVRLALGLAGATPRRSRFGMRRHYSVRPWTNYVEVYWSPVGEAYVTPVAEDLVGVAILAKRGSGAYEGLLEYFPALKERIAGAPTVGSVMGAGPMAQVTRRRTKGRTLLVGDAAGYVDALTGEGLAVGFAMARAAVAAVAAGNPEQYEREWARLTRRQRWSTSALVSATEFGPLRRALLPAAVALPSVFARSVNALA
jgi:flavin-dependent dehydrogenase